MSLVKRFVKIPTILIVLFTYSLIVLLIYFAITKYVPVLVNQTLQMYNSVIKFYQNTEDGSNQIITMVNDYLEKRNLTNQIQHGASLLLNYIRDLGILGISFVFPFILSFFL